MSSFDTRSTPPNTSESSENVKPHRFRKRKTLPLKDHCKARTIFTNKRKVLPTPPSYDRDQDQSISNQSQETTTKRVRFSPDVTFIDAAAPSQNTRPSDPPPAHRLQGLSIPASEPPFPNPVSPQQHRDRPTAAPPTDTHSQTRRRRIYQTSSLVVLSLTCLSLNLPLSVYAIMTCLSSPHSWPAALQHSPGRWFVFVSTLNMFVTPLVYCWVFVSWRCIWGKLRRLRVLLLSLCGDSDNIIRVT